MARRRNERCLTSDTACEEGANSTIVQFRFGHRMVPFLVVTVLVLLSLLVLRGSAGMTAPIGELTLKVGLPSNWFVPSASPQLVTSTSHVADAGITDIPIAGCRLALTNVAQTLQLLDHVIKSSANGAESGSYSRSELSPDAIGVRWCLGNQTNPQSTQVESDAYYRYVRNDYIGKAEEGLTGSDVIRAAAKWFEPPTQRITRWLHESDLSFVNGDEFRRRALAYSLVDDVLPIVKYESAWWKTMLLKMYGAFAPVPPSAPLVDLYANGTHSRLVAVRISNGGGDDAFVANSTSNSSLEAEGGALGSNKGATEEEQQRQAVKKSRHSARDSVSELQMGLRRLFGRKFTSADSAEVRLKTVKGKVAVVPPQAPFLPGPPGSHFETRTRRPLRHHSELGGDRQPPSLARPSPSSTTKLNQRETPLSPFVFGVLTEGQFRSRIDSILGTWLQGAFHVYLFFDAASPASQAVAPHYDPFPSPPLTATIRRELVVNRQPSLGIPLQRVCGLGLFEDASPINETKKPSSPSVDGGESTDDRIMRNVTVQFVETSQEIRSEAPNAAWKVWEIVKVFAHKRTLSFLDAKASALGAGGVDSARLPLWFVIIDDDVYLNAYNWAFTVEPHTQLLHESYKRWHISRNQRPVWDSRCDRTLYGGHTLTLAPTSSFVLRQTRFVFGGTGILMSRAMVLKAAAQFGICLQTWRRLAGDEQLGACISRFVPRHYEPKSRANPPPAGSYLRRAPTILPSRFLRNISFSRLQDGTASLLDAADGGKQLSHEAPDQLLALLPENTEVSEPLTNWLLMNHSHRTFNFEMVNNKGGDIKLQREGDDGDAVVVSDALLREAIGCADPYNDPNCSTEERAVLQQDSLSEVGIFTSLQSAYREARNEGMFPSLWASVEAPFHPINYFRSTGFDKFPRFAGSLYVAKERVPYTSVAHHHIKKPSEYWSLHTVELALRRREALLGYVWRAIGQQSNNQNAENDEAQLPSPPSPGIGAEIVKVVLQAGFSHYDALLAAELGLAMHRVPAFGRFINEPERRLATMREMLLVVLGDAWGVRRALAKGRSVLFDNRTSAGDMVGLEGKSSPSSAAATPTRMSSAPSMTEVFELYLAGWTTALGFQCDALAVSTSGVALLKESLMFNKAMLGAASRERAAIQTGCMRRATTPKTHVLPTSNPPTAANEGRAPQAETLDVGLAVMEGVAMSSVPDKGGGGDSGQQSPPLDDLNPSNPIIASRQAPQVSLMENFIAFNQPNELFPEWVVEEEIARRLAETRRLRKVESGKLKKTRLVRRQKG